MKKFIWVFCACAAAVWGQCPSTYTAQRAITVNSGQVTGTLTNYPMLVLNPTNGLANPQQPEDNWKRRPRHQRERLRHHFRERLRCATSV